MKEQGNATFGENTSHPLFLLPRALLFPTHQHRPPPSAASRSSSTRASSHFTASIPLPDQPPDHRCLIPSSFTASTSHHLCSITTYPILLLQPPSAFLLLHPRSSRASLAPIITITSPSSPSPQPAPISAPLCPAAAVLPSSSSLTSPANDPLFPISDSHLLSSSSQINRLSP